MENKQPKVYRVSELTTEIQDLLADRFEFVWVEGEISNLSSPASGHRYMVIKDEKSQIRAVMFRVQARYLKFAPENGMHVLAQGRVGVYAPRGEYQLILDYLEPMGVGALALAFEQLKKKLATQGVFHESLKKPLPFLPQRVAVITSPSGAAIRDFLKVIGRRFANIEIVVVPVRVQGEGAAGDMVKALDLVNRKLDMDVIVLARGGGSLEDLWAFNEEELALAIRKSDIPVVSAVGHEIDMTISDLAADFRAPTPSAAAELLVQEKESLQAHLDDLKVRLLSQVRKILNYSADDLNSFSQRLKSPRQSLDEIWMRLDEIVSRFNRAMDYLFRGHENTIKSGTYALMAFSPQKRISGMHRQLEFLETSLGRAVVNRLKDTRTVLSFLEKRIIDLSPLTVLKRGYSITRKIPEKDVVRTSSDIETGGRVEVLLSEGELRCRVEKINKSKTLN